MHLLVATATAAAQDAQATRVRLEFRAASDSVAAARDEYERIWASDGEKMIAALEKAAGLRFVYPLYADTLIPVTVREVGSNSGYRDRSGMTMRASYPTDTKKATLMHELGHRLMSGFYRRDEPDEHDKLFLFLYDAWIALYGKEFADAQVEIEKRRGGRYPPAWDSALALSATERAAEWARIRTERLARRL